MVLACASTELMRAFRDRFCRRVALAANSAARQTANRPSQCSFLRTLDS